jgi:hypothetical protein
MTNFSAYPTRRVSLNFHVALDKDVETISSNLRSYLEQNQRVLDSPSPSVTTSNLTEGCRVFGAGLGQSRRRRALACRLRSAMPSGDPGSEPTEQGSQELA